jgi:flagellar hook assembly protein FlgD
VPPATPGAYTLRLVAIDAAQNQAETRATVNVGPRAFIGRIGAAPQIFSPNGDGKADTTTIEYQLLVSGMVTLQVKDSGGSVVKTFESQVQHAPGVYDFVWDGKTDSGSAAPEGDLPVAIQVSGGSGSGIQSQATTETLDLTGAGSSPRRPP